jgi:hypothetical protein
MGLVTDDLMLASLLAYAQKLEILAKEARHKYEQRLCENYPFKAGDVIKSSTGQLAQVTQIVIQYGEPRIMAVLQKKDGHFGKRPAALWRAEWDNPEHVTL